MLPEYFIRAEEYAERLAKTLSGVMRAMVAAVRSFLVLMVGERIHQL